METIALRAGMFTDTEDSIWRNRAEFLSGRDKIREFLRRKWNQELDDRLKKELWIFTDNPDI